MKNAATINTVRASGQSVQAERNALTGDMCSGTALKDMGVSLTTNAAH